MKILLFYFLMKSVMYVVQDLAIRMSELLAGRAGWLHCWPRRPGRPAQSGNPGQPLNTPCPLSTAGYCRKTGSERSVPRSGFPALEVCGSKPGG